jgi:hypothetical protein
MIASAAAGTERAEYKAALNFAQVDSSCSSSASDTDEPPQYRCLPPPDDMCISSQPQYGDAIKGYQCSALESEESACLDTHEQKQDEQPRGYLAILLESCVAGIGKFGFS